MFKSDNQSRRQFIQQLGAVMGAGAAASLLTASSVQAAFAYQRSDGAKIAAGRLFSQTQMQLLAQICDAILPKTQTPSGSEVDCHGFVDNQLMACHSEAEQQAAIHALQEIAQHCKQIHQTAFAHLTNQQQQALLIQIETAQNGSSTSKDDFKRLKALIVFGYFTSEPGATQALTYQMIPGGYKGSIPATADTKAWGSLAYY